jgi:hypothetical protein
MERLGLSWNSIEAVWQGSKLTTGQRRDINNAVSNLYNAEAQQHQQRVNEYKRIATESNLNPSRVITDMSATGEAPEPGQGRYSDPNIDSGSAPTPQAGGRGRGQGITPAGGSAPTSARAGGAMDTLPPAKDHPGQIVRDTKTGQRLKSNGTKWVAMD